MAHDVYAVFMPFIMYGILCYAMMNKSRKYKMYDRKIVIDGEQVPVVYPGEEAIIARMNRGAADGLCITLCIVLAVQTNFIINNGSEMWVFLLLPAFAYFSLVTQAKFTKATIVGWQIFAGVVTILSDPWQTPFGALGEIAAMTILAVLTTPYALEKFGPAVYGDKDCDRILAGKCNKYRKGKK